MVVGYGKPQIIERPEDEYRDVPLTYAHQREQVGLAHALLQADPHVDDDFVLMLGDNVVRANLGDVVEYQRNGSADAAFLVKEIALEEARCYGVATRRNSKREHSNELADR